MKRRMRPIADAPDQAMFHGIDVAIFDMASIIGFITDQVLPEAPLPDAAFAARDANVAEPLLFWKCPCKPALISRHRVEKSRSPGGKVQIASR